MNDYAQVTEESKRLAKEAARFERIAFLRPMTETGRRDFLALLPIEDRDRAEWWALVQSVEAFGR